MENGGCFIEETLYVLQMEAAYLEVDDVFMGTLSTYFIVCPPYICNFRLK